MNFWSFDLSPKNTGLMGLKYIQAKVLKVIKLVIQNSKFISPICDEIITMNNASWANVHGYIVQD
jgi:hypothetical protein